jgi:hypothetical protein
VANLDTRHFLHPFVTRLITSPQFLHPQTGNALQDVSTLPVEPGDSWSYFKGTQEPPSDWTAVDFDDSGWLVGPSGFGYGDGDDATLLEDMQDNYTSLYIRHEFYVEEPTIAGLLTLSVIYDDGYVAYLNGAEVWRGNVSGENPSHTTLADEDHEALYFEENLIDSTLLITGTNVLAIQGHNVALDSSDFSLNPTLVVKDVIPYLQDVRQDSIHILWETSHPTISKARHREVGASTWIETSNENLVTQHNLGINSLNQDTLYEYQVLQEGMTNWISNTYTFKTSPATDASYRVAIYGDSQKHYEIHTEIAANILRQGPGIILHTGDLVENGTQKNEWYQQLFFPAEPMIANIALYPTMGDHEFVETDPMLFYEYFEHPGNDRWFAFTYGCTRFVGLDTNISTDFAPNSLQYNWLLDEMQSPVFQEALWQIIYFHEPPFTSGIHTPKLTVQEYLVPLFEQNGIDLVFSGHNHQYERSYKDGIYYIVTGGGGGYLYDFPNVDLNPYSQVRIKSHHHVTLDFDCPSQTLTYQVWNDEGQLIDGPLWIDPHSNPFYLPIILNH